MCDPVTAGIVGGIGLYGAKRAGDRAANLAGLSEEQMDLVKEWADREWAYQEPLLQEYLKRSQAMNPMYMSMASLLGDELGLDMGSYLNELYGNWDENIQDGVNQPTYPGGNTQQPAQPVQQSGKAALPSGSFQGGNYIYIPKQYASQFGYGPTFKTPKGEFVEYSSGNPVFKGYDIQALANKASGVQQPAVTRSPAIVDKGKGYWPDGADPTDRSGDAKDVQKVGGYNVPKGNINLVGGQTQKPAWMNVPTGDFKLPDVPDYDPSKLPESHKVSQHLKYALNNVPGFDPAKVPEAHKVSESLASALGDVPDWKNPMTREQESAFTNISDLGLSQKKNDIRSSLNMNLAKRGLSAPGVTSGVALSKDVSAQNWFDKASSEESAKLAIEKMARGDMLRGENVANQAILDSLRRQQSLDEMSRYLTTEELAALRRGEQVDNQVILDRLMRQESEDSMKRFLTGEELAAARRAELANKLLTEEGVGRDRRSEGARNYYNLLSALSGGAADLSGYGDMSGYSNQALNASKMYQGMANQYANDQANIINNLFGIFGKLYGGKDSSLASLL